MSLFRLATGDTARAGDVYDGTTGNDKLLSDELAAVLAKHKAAPYGVDTIQFNLGSFVGGDDEARWFKLPRAGWLADARMYVGTTGGTATNIFAANVAMSSSLGGTTTLNTLNHSWVVGSGTYDDTHLVMAIERGFVPANWWLRVRVNTGATVTLGGVTASLRVLKLHTS